jgi:hypothetical protein
MARTPRKKAAIVDPVTTNANALTFGEPTPFDALPPKEAALPGYRQIEALEANTMISVTGADEAAMKTLVKKVQRNNKGRKYDVRAVDPVSGGAGVNVYRIA